MSDMDSEEKAAAPLPHVADMVREIRRQTVTEANRLLLQWLDGAWDRGHYAGLNEGLTRAATPVLRTTVDDLLRSNAGSNRGDCPSSEGTAPSTSPLETK